MASSSKSYSNKLDLQLEILEATRRRREAVDTMSSANDDIVSMSRFLRHLEKLPESEDVLNSKIVTQKVILNAYNLIDECNGLIKVIDIRVSLMKKMVKKM